MKFRNCYTSYFSSTNRLIYYKAFIVSAIVCIALSFLALAILKIGIVGLILAQIFSQVFFNAWYWAFKAHQEMKLGIAEMFELVGLELKKVLDRKKV